MRAQQRIDRLEKEEKKQGDEAFSSVGYKALSCLDMKKLVEYARVRIVY